MQHTAMYLGYTTKFTCKDVKLKHNRGITMTKINPLKESGIISFYF